MLGNPGQLTGIYGHFKLKIKGLISTFMLKNTWLIQFGAGGQLIPYQVLTEFELTLVEKQSGHLSLQMTSYVQLIHSLYFLSPSHSNDAHDK